MFHVETPASVDANAVAGAHPADHNDDRPNDRDLAYEHFSIAGAIVRDYVPEHRESVADALHQMLRTLYGDEMMLDVYRSYVENNSAHGSCLG